MLLSHGVPICASARGSGTTSPTAAALCDSDGSRFSQHTNGELTERGHAHDRKAEAADPLAPCNVRHWVLSLHGFLSRTGSALLTLLARGGRCATSTQTPGNPDLPSLAPLIKMG
jgi:hypothetical protein